MKERLKRRHAHMVQVNDIVKARYNSGEYIGRVLEERGNFLLVEVLAVLEHPQQGDLHHLGEVDGVAFHERKALAYREKFNARKDRKSTRLNSSHVAISYAVFCLKKK